ncbi:hypothetical protein DAPPUDRAFT_106387 [Daphnia pulex]|uniref:Peptidase M12A domain-containing protein n=1 Tax=Daphnia pulex TaxID=6669 RepID=E9GTP7_DAPPU|nr:hypothetical protein DAPPUDRAFT_106387 [Daphnia pulex]|eukprot:EFX77171.1 hypothetical protein DAPPUDRAFT_106387 [Daphnia pulex]
MMKITAIIFCTLSVLVAKSSADSDPTTFREPDAPMSDDATVDLSGIALGNADPDNEIPGEPLTPADFNNAKKVSMDPPPRDKLGGDPIEIAGLFEGDIAGVSSADMAIGKSFKLGKSGAKPMGKNAIIDMNLRWPSSTIPYVISASFGEFNLDSYQTQRIILEIRNFIYEMLASMARHYIVAIVSVTHD